MDSPYRDTFRVWGYKFGGPKNTLAIVGALRGDEVHQQYICSQVVGTLMQLEKEGKISKELGVLVIPSSNPFSMNIGKRFWAMDNTDINRMFPGYDLGETTQRIASGLFEQIKDFEYGIQLASYYLPGEFMPHVKMVKTGYEDVEGAKLFGLPYVCLKETTPFDTTTLNYNWQIWNAKAYMIYGGKNSEISSPRTAAMIQTLFKFLSEIGITCSDSTANIPSYNSKVIDESELVTLHAESAGIFHKIKSAGEMVVEGEHIASIIDPYEGVVKSEVRSPKGGVIFYALDQPLALLNTPLFRII